MHAQNAVGGLLDEELDETVGLLVGLGSRVGEEGELKTW